MPEDEDDDLMRRQGEMYRDRELVFERGAALPSGVWTGLRMDGPDVVVLLTEIEPHSAALLEGLEHPDRVHFERAPYSRAELEEVHAQLREMLPDHSWWTHGPGLERVHVGLRASRAALAEALRHRFGDRLTIGLGRHAYPLDLERAPTTVPTPVSEIDLPGLETEVEPSASAFPPGEDITGRVHVRNGGPDAVRVFSGSASDGVLLDDADRVVGVFSGVRFLPGGSTRVDPGASASVQFLAGSDTLDPRLGAALPPGAYRLVVSLRVAVGDPPDREFQQLVTAPVPVRIEAAAVD